MLRRCLTASVAASLVLLTPVAAHAASPIVSRVGLPSGFTASPGATGCTNSPTGSVAHVTGPGTPPSGAGSLQLNATGGSTEDVEYDLSTVTPASSLTSFVVHSYLPANGAPANSDLFIFLNDTGDANLSYQGRLSLPSEVDAWVSTDLIASSATNWTEYDAETQQFTPLGTASYATFIGAHPVSLDHILVAADACPLSLTKPDGHLNVDDISVTVSASTTEYDFEAPVATKLVGHLSPTTIPYQHAIAPTATLTADGGPFADKAVSLWAKSAGATTFAKVGTVTTNSRGVATAAAQHPKKNTTYQWRYAGDGVTFGPSTSSSLTVHVGSKLSINAAAKVKKGKTFTATGVMTPARKGDQITLYATKSGHKTKLATGKIHGDGSYALTGKLKKTGRYKIFTTAAADSTNAKGSSPQKSLKVH